MNIYLLSRTLDQNEYDSYVSAIVLAKTEEEARSMHPYDGSIYDNLKGWTNCMSWAWAKNPTRVNATLLGVADKNIIEIYENKVILFT